MRALRQRLAGRSGRYRSGSDPESRSDAQAEVVPVVRDDGLGGGKGEELKRQKEDGGGVPLASSRTPPRGGDELAGGKYSVGDSGVGDQSEQGGDEEEEEEEEKERHIDGGVKVSHSNSILWSISPLAQESGSCGDNIEEHLGCQDSLESRGDDSPCSESDCLLKNEDIASSNSDGPLLDAKEDDSAWEKIVSSSAESRLSSIATNVIDSIQSSVPSMSLSPKKKNPDSSDSQPTQDPDTTTESICTVGAPEVVNMPEEMWCEVVETAQRCWRDCCDLPKPPTAPFAELGLLAGCIQLQPRSDPDVASSQLMKDIRRETVQVNGTTFVGATNFEALYSALEEILVSHDPELSGTPLEHKVQRILRGCSRTVSGYDTFDVVSALMARMCNPNALVTPAMMNNSPIRIEFEQGSTMLTLISVNVFKISRELNDGTLATVVVIKTEVTEQIDLGTWSTVRWMSMKPLDKAEECLSSILLFRDRTLDALVEKTSRTDEQFNKALFEVIEQVRSSLDLAIDQSIKAIKNLAQTEYQRGSQDTAQLQPS